MRNTLQGISEAGTTHEQVGLHMRGREDTSHEGIQIPFHRSFFPRLLSANTLCSATPERSDSRRLRALSPGCKLLWMLQS